MTTLVLKENTSEILAEKCTISDLHYIGLVGDSLSAPLFQALLEQIAFDDIVTKKEMVFF